MILRRTSRNPLPLDTLDQAVTNDNTQESLIGVDDSGEWVEVNEKVEDIPSEWYKPPEKVTFKVNK